jgi:hypothetical protein
MKDIMIFVAVMAGWIVLNIWVLPYFGIRTCMSGACRVPEMKPTELRSPNEQAVPIEKLTEEAGRR